ncbi:MAG TPA: hypothetical protein VLI41_14445 [Phenylobacterium sp.]|uniref:hypothetical protein n=1 Tax=Phenylobacterium sp. TaxID=1871053 RepID=UPI002B543ACE|nr:hypothetical protein [Phenylobacterium sp.]HSV04391.1 hypothetical protein [Phenylobacterium sp.]
MAELAAKFLRPAESDDLPYRVELRDASGAGVARLLAACHSPALGYTSYYAALREFFGQHVTLSEGDRLLAATGAQRR